MCNFDFDLSFCLLLKNHLMTGILDKNGTPEPESLLCFFDRPKVGNVDSSSKGHQRELEKELEALRAIYGDR